MALGQASSRFKPYLFVQQEKMTHMEFSKKFVKGTITDYLIKADLVQECIDWLKIHYPDEGFNGQAGGMNPVSRTC